MSDNSIKVAIDVADPALAERIIVLLTEIADIELVAVPGLRARSNLTVDSLPAALEAAAAGHGVMLGLHPLVWDAPAARRLVVPIAKPRVSGGAYYVVHRKADASRLPVRLFVAWLQAEMGDDIDRLKRMPKT